MKLIATATAALGLVLAATPALAQISQVQPETRIVAFATNDIDLATPKGQKELNWRITRAVRNVCQVSVPDSSSRILSADAKACMAKAHASAQKQVAQLMASDAQKGG
ncbi:UrcA family protein [Erythrobacter sp. T5W1-R]|uniref:UrcA family protein n=1 Tax=Erythrobacter sp. T5W1-R TaxID=3101752 RepID=UPI002AFEE9F9|nr:UrcA family protein [Erythrobacter sp. T5W1-R]MEA1618788.1 UrcA family protein [Erythrobacter sp. T5W1-R]